MQYGSKIIIGLIIFLGLLLAPLALNATKSYKQPDLKLDALKAKYGSCVESADFMRTKHMQLLDEWRDWALRDGKRVYINHDGKEFEISLQNTCMKCHTSKKDFCDKCHNDAGVSPYCWDCHVVPEGLK